VTGEKLVFDKTPPGNNWQIQSQ